MPVTCYAAVSMDKSKLRTIRAYVFLAGLLSLILPAETLLLSRVPRWFGSVHARPAASVYVERRNDIENRRWRCVIAI
ncbi:hypothetical protein CC77DRAFT_617547 [Alternaria alternata]|uniref:Uncharacterized protein n=1 Tax=Alternaria alternata TaxID=5599 RepID=A0A177DVD4_ALTAL|nr:hypothetical protein CC77DRAFT_617547 [Alternaria alternata]OAG23664.1 hypothetical protein CC77DRAFT_617547 [Alternaria alternata]